MSIDSYINLLIVCTIVSYIWGCIKYNKILTTCMSYGKYNNPLFLIFFSLTIIMLHYKLYNSTNISNIILISLFLNIILMIISTLSFSFKNVFYIILHYILSVIVFLFLSYYMYKYVAH
jgi:hypothetical protein